MNFCGLVGAFCMSSVRSLRRRWYAAAFLSLPWSCYLQSATRPLNQKPLPCFFSRQWLWVITVPTILWLSS